MDQYKPFGEKAIRRGSATKPNGFAPIQFAAASPKKFSACCILQDVLSKILDALQFAEASRKKFWPKCTLQHVLSKVFGLLHFAGCSLKSFGLAAKCGGFLQKVLDPLQFAAALPQKLWLQCSVQHLAAKWFGSAASGGEYFSFGLML